MNIYQFSLLDIKDKEVKLFQEGTLLAARQEDEIMLELYQFHSYYVEFIYYINEQGNMVVRCFTTVDELKPYLDIIDISSITSLEGIDG